MGRRIFSRVLLIVFMSVSLNASIQISKQQCLEHNSAKGCYDFSLDLIEKTEHDNGNISDAKIWAIAIKMMSKSCDGGYAEACAFLYETSIKLGEAGKAQYYLKESCRLGNTAACRLLR